MKARRPPAYEQTWMKLAPAQREAWIRLLAAHRRVTAALGSALEDEHGLSLAEWDVLVHLAPTEDGVRMSDLADLVLLTPSGMTRLMGRLEERGLVERHRSEDDARATLARITKRGLDLLAKAAPLHNEELKTHFLDGLTVDECEKLAALLRKVDEASRRADCPRHPE